MHPTDLKAEQFSSYPPQARKLAVNNLILFRRLPEILLPILLQKLIVYDWTFPAERKDLEDQLSYLNALSSDALQSHLAGFSKLKLSPALEKIDWVKFPRGFVEGLTAELWATNQMESFRTVADEYQRSVSSSIRQEMPVIPRLAIAVIGQGVGDYSEPIFQKLRPYGVYFKNVRPENGLPILMHEVTQRAAEHPVPYAHWYIDGGNPPGAAAPGITSISYGAIERQREALLGKMQSATNSGDGGPEALRTFLAQMRPEDLGFSNLPEDTILNRFQVALLTEGSGTQVFSTIFAQWAAREVLRRAQPLTLLVRFAPRQRQQPFNELLSAKHTDPEVDPLGSLVDADMGAYYTWLNQQRLSAAEQSSFLAWFEGHAQALAIGPSLPRGTESSTPTDLNLLLKLVV
jgi:hypothetical protein